MRLIALLFLIAMASPSYGDAVAPTPRAGDVCFKITGGLNIGGESKRNVVCKSELPRLLRMPIERPLEWPKYEFKKSSINTCSQYLRTIGYGGYTGSRAELAFEVPYLRTCGLLVALQSAQRGRNLFSSPKHALKMKSLPPTIAFHAATGDQADRLSSYEDEDVSAQDLIS